MVSRGSGSKLLVIVGPTASGKSGLAFRVAQEFGGEIIAADSRTIYKGMDIGTAKPSKQEQKLVPHWGLDLVEPGERFSAAAFKKYAEAVVKDIQSRGKLPILVGGTGLYIDSVLFDFGFRADANLLNRQKLEKLSVPELQEIIQEQGYKMPENQQNKRHLIRTIEAKGQTGSRKKSLPEGVILVGLLPPDEILRRRINRRAQTIFDSGVLQETRVLLKKYGRSALLASLGIVYKICLEIVDSKITEQEAIEKFKIADWQYARRQKTWFKRNKFIQWFESSEQAYEFLRTDLAKR